MIAFVISLILSTAHAQSTSPHPQKGVQTDACAVTIPYDQHFQSDFGEFCRYEAANRALPKATDARVVYFGDSITQGWGKRIVGLAVDDVINRGVGGQTTPQLLVRFRADVLNLKPRIVHILAGTNDIAGNSGPTTTTRIQDNIATMAELARAHGIRVVLGSILPAKKYGWAPHINPAPSVAAINKWLEAYALREGFIYADYFSVLNDGTGGMRPEIATDGIHPTAAGYSLMVRVAEDAITKANR